ncbi:MAG: NADPH-dependent F420 reductase [Chlorobiaceae bacterium]|nr:MAG: dependent NADPH reductase [Chloroflexota bacterium]MBA4311020.1 NADPH-dependent F420 reductase [Chlorobiaceae bacterium]
MINRIAILGGTGKEGKGLAYRWAKAGYEIVIGSRQVEKAQIVADELNQLVGNAKVAITGLENHQAADWCDIAVLTIPFSGHKALLESLKECLKEKILIDVTVPLVPPKVTRVQMPPAGSAAQEAKLILGENVQVVSAFQNISYEKLLTDQDIDCDVLVCGSSKEARSIVLELVERAGMTGWDAGPIENSVVAEGLTSILIGINKEFGEHTAGIKITGIKRA